MRHDLKDTRHRRVAVVGGGITGLAAAHRLIELDPSLDVTLLEANDQLGGVLETVQLDEYSLEKSADAFITNVPWALDLCRRIGLDGDLIQTNDQHRQAFVVHNQRLCRIPEGFLIMAPRRLWPIMTTPILSMCGKLRLAWEYFIPPKLDEGDESLASFAIRRLGRETYERLVQPLVGAIHTTDPEKLSLKAALPRFLEMERKHGSLIKAVRNQTAKQPGRDEKSSGAAYSMFVTPRDGMSSLVQAIAGCLPDGTVRTGAPVKRIAREKEGLWSLSIGDNNQTTLAVDAVVIATPARGATRLLEDVNGELATLLKQIGHSPCSIVSLAYRREQIGHPLDGFGFIVPLIENRKILSGSFSSVKFAGRAPAGHELLRVFVGGARQSEFAKLPDGELLALVTAELEQLLDIRGEPLLYHISHWPTGMPQYCTGHCGLVEQIESLTKNLPNFELAGNWLHGIGIPHCIHSGESAAERIIRGLRHEEAELLRHPTLC